MANNEDKELKNVLALLRSVLMSEKAGVALRRLIGDYRSIAGDFLPFKKFGCRTLEEFLQRHPDVVSVQPNREGELTCYAVADATTAKIASLVSRQRSKANKKKTGRFYRGRGGGGYYPSYQPAQFQGWRGGPPRQRFPAARATNQGMYRAPNQTSRGGRGGGWGSRPAAPRATSPVPPASNPAYRQSAKMTPTTAEPEYRANPRDRKNDGQNEQTETIHSRTTRAPWNLPPRLRQQHQHNPSPETEDRGEQQETLIPQHPETVPSPSVNKTYVNAVKLFAGTERLAFHTVPVGSNFVSSFKLKRHLYGSGGMYPTGREAEERAAQNACQDLGIDLDGNLKNASLAQVDRADETLKDRVRSILEKHPNGVFSDHVIKTYEEKYNEGPPGDLLQRFQTWTKELNPLFEYDENVTTGRPILRQRTQPTPTRWVPSVVQDVRRISVELPSVGDVLKVYPVEVVHPGEIYVHREDSEAVLNKLRTELQEAYKDRSAASDMDKVEPKMYCAAQYTEDNMWCRAKIVKVFTGEQETIVTLHFIDFGNLQQSPSSALRRLKDKFYDVPACAMKCRLDQVVLDEGNLLTKATEELTKVLFEEENPIRMRVGAVEGDTISVTMRTSRLGNESVNERILVHTSALMSAKSEDVGEFNMDGEPGLHLEDDTMASGDAMESLDPRERLREAMQSSQTPVPVMISHLATDGFLYVQLEGRGHTRLQTLIERITRQLQEPGLEVDVIDETTLYMAYSEGTWYRCTLQQQEDDEVEAFFVDLGSRAKFTTGQRHKLKRLKALNAELYDLPVQAVECQFEGFSEIWTETAGDHVAGLLDQNERTEIVFLEGMTTVNQEDPLTVDLRIHYEDKTVISVCQELHRRKEQLFDCYEEGIEDEWDAEDDEWNTLDETGEVSAMLADTTIQDSADVTQNDTATEEDVPNTSPAEGRPQESANTESTPEQWKDSSQTLYTTSLESNSFTAGAEDNATDGTLDLPPELTESEEEELWNEMHADDLDAVEEEFIGNQMSPDLIDPDLEFTFTEEDAALIEAYQDDLESSYVVRPSGFAVETLDLSVIPRDQSAAGSNPKTETSFGGDMSILGNATPRKSIPSDTSTPNKPPLPGSLSKGSEVQNVMAQPAPSNQTRSLNAVDVGTIENGAHSPGKSDSTHMSSCSQGESANSHNNSVMDTSRLENWLCFSAPSTSNTPRSTDTPMDLSAPGPVINDKSPVGYTPDANVLFRSPGATTVPPAACAYEPISSEPLWSTHFEQSWTEVTPSPYQRPPTAAVYATSASPYGGAIPKAGRGRPIVGASGFAKPVYSIGEISAGSPSHASSAQLIANSTRSPPAPKSSCLPPVTTGDKVFVTWASDPHNLKLVPEKRKPDLERLMDKMKTHYEKRGSNAKSPAQVEVGRMYAALRVDDQRWYRCVVKQSVNEIEYTVQYVDYGDFDKLMKAELANLPEEFNQVPPFAFSAKLHDFSFSDNGTWPKEMVSKLEEEIAKKTVKVLRLSQGEADDICAVELTTEDCSTALTQALIQT